MSCQQGQTAVAKRAAAVAGISKDSSRAAGGGQSGPQLAANRPLRPRAVRQASKMYGKLPMKKKEKLWAAVSQAALTGTKAERQTQLSRAVAEFGAGVVAAALAADLNRAKTEQDDWAVERYRELEKMLPTATPPTATQAKARAALTGTGREQVSFFEQHRGDEHKKELPTGRRVINLTDGFGADELRQLSTQLALGAAAARRQLKLLTRNDAPRGIGHSDPRVWDWVEQDQNNFQFLHDQVTQARQRNNGLIDLSALSDGARVELWEFAKFEADRALRNIDHLQSGWSHLKGPTAAYITSQHKLEARFFSYVAAQLEPTLTPAMLDQAGVISL